MNRTLVLVAVLALAACSKKKEDKPAEPAKPTEPAAGSDKKDTAPADDKKPEAPQAKDDKKLPDEPMVDMDLAPFGKQFAGWVVTAPQSAKLEFDDPSRHIVLSDTDFVALDEAPYWEDGIKALDQDKDNQNIKKVSATEVRYERTPPLGKSWLVDILVKVGKEKWGCGTGMTGTFTSEAMADRIATICKSIRKK